MSGCFGYLRRIFMMPKIGQITQMNIFELFCISDYVANNKDSEVTARDCFGLLFCSKLGRLGILCPKSTFLNFSLNPFMRFF